MTVKSRKTKQEPVRSAALGVAASALLLLAAVLLAACGSSDSGTQSTPQIPADAIAVVQKAPNGTISKAEYKAALLQAVPRLGLSRLPADTTPQFAKVKEAAISDLILGRWIVGEAADRGITASNTQVHDQLEQTIKTQFGNSEAKFLAFLRQSHFSKADALERVRLEVLSTQIQSAVLSADKTPLASASEIAKFYRSHIAEFQVKGSHPAIKTPLSKVAPQIKKLLAAKKQREIATNFQKSFVHRWRSRTICAAGYRINRCSNGPPFPVGGKLSGGGGLAP
jgi:hypothetical protein